MKKIFIVLVAFLFVASAAFAVDNYSGSRLGNLVVNAKTIYNDTRNDYGHTHVTTSATNVYRVTLTSTDSATYLQMFDSNTTGQNDSTAALISNLAKPTKNGNVQVKADICATTANTTYSVAYDPPLRFENGLLVGFAGVGSTAGVDDLGAGAIATATIEYRQE